MADKIVYMSQVPMKVVDLNDGTHAQSVSLLDAVVPVTQSERLLSVTQIGDDQAVAFANSALINTQVNVDIVKPATFSQRYQIVVYNPSTVTDLTVKIFGKCLTFGGDTRYSFYDSFTVLKSQAITGTTINTYVKEIEGIFADTDLRLVVSNVTGLGAADGFSAYVRVKAV